MKFTAVAFDLDGTLYPNFSFYRRLVPFLLKEQRLMRAMGKARAHLRKHGDYGSEFYRTQAGIMGKILGENTEGVKEKAERLIYRGWEPIFKKVKLFPHVRETLETFRKAGIKMGLLSDFPPEAKLENLEISGYWDIVLCSELIGRLKPDPTPFLHLAGLMGMETARILYVGNSFPYDVEGAGRVGMKTAFIRTGLKSLVPARAGADFCFSDYRQLCDYVLN